MTSRTTSGIAKALLGFVVALVLLGPARAAPAEPAPGLVAAPFAEEHWTFSRFIHKYANRAHVVQLCVVCMLLALFIIIKKLDGDGSPRPLPLRESSALTLAFRNRDRKGVAPDRRPLPYGRGSETPEGGVEWCPGIDQPSAGPRPDLTPSSQPRDGASP
jgi:hypothetical protein